MRTEAIAQTEPSQWLNTITVANFCEMTPKWVASQCQEGKIKGTKIGGYWKVTPTHLYEYLKSMQNHNEELPSAVIEELARLNGGSL